MQRCWLGGFRRLGLFSLRLHFLLRFSFFYSRFTQHLSVGSAVLQRSPQFAKAVPQADQPRFYTIQRRLNIPIYKKEDRYRQAQDQQGKRPDCTDNILQPIRNAKAHRPAP